MSGLCSRAGVGVYYAEVPSKSSASESWETALPGRDLKRRAVLSSRFHGKHWRNRRV